MTETGYKLMVDVKIVFNFFFSIITLIFFLIIFPISGYGDIVYALENNCSMRNIPFPVFDVAPCLKNHPERTDAIMRKMQEYLQRNSNGYKRANGQAFRLQHGFLLSSTHQLVDKLVSETQETISLRHGLSACESNVQRLIEDAENSKQLLPKLQEAVRCEQHPIEVKLGRVASDLNQSIKTYLEETLETMLRTGIEQCPKTLGNHSVVSDLRKTCHDRLNISEDFLHNCILNNAGSEIMNKIRYEYKIFIKKNCSYLQLNVPFFCCWFLNVYFGCSLSQS